jgi:hypothetical protein
VLFHRAWLRRLIKPSITPDELFYNLMVDRQRFFDNKDNVLSVDLLASKVKESFRYSTEELIERYKDVYEKTKLRSSVSHQRTPYFPAEILFVPLRGILIYRV